MEPRFRPYRSLFWPILLIGVGLVWLMGNLGLIPPTNLNLLLSLWPLILIVIGLDLLVGRGSPAIGAAIGLLAVIVVLVVLVAGPALGLKAPGGEFKVDHFTAPISSTTSATYNFNTGSEPVRVRSLSGSNDLIDATIGHYGQMEFNVSSGSDKTITLRHAPSVTGFSFGLGNFSQLRWDIGLTPSVASRIEISSGSGPITLDLTGLKLTGLTSDSGSGPVGLTLPESSTAYTVDTHSGSGPMVITLPNNTDLTLTIDSGSGPVNIHMPSGSALRVEASDHGSGGLHLPSGMNQLNGDKNEGTWESTNYASAAHKVLVRVQGAGSGPITVR